MRFRVRALLGAPVLALLLSMGVTGCSGDQQSDEAVDNNGDNQAANNNDDGSGGDNNANAAGADDNGSGGGAADDNAASSGGDSGGDTAAADSGDGAKADGGGGNENDLQEIIKDMNGNGSGGDASAQGGDAGGGNAPAAQAADGGGNAPAAAPANNAAAAPASAPANASANAAASAPAANNSASNGKGAQPSAPQADDTAKSTPLPFQPGGTPAAPGLPELGSKMAYVVEKGDTLAKISQKVYGTNGRWQEMATLSGITNPSRIFPGDLVYYTLDESAVAFAKAYDTIQRSEEQVKPGDTLATIAQRLYGSTTAWRSIWRHNDRIDNPDIVTPGTTVYYVPKGALQAAISKIRRTQTQIAAKTQHHKKHLKTLASKVRTTHVKTVRSISKLSKLAHGIQLAGNPIMSQLQTVQLTV